MNGAVEVTICLACGGDEEPREIDPCKLQTLSLVSCPLHTPQQQLVEAKKQASNQPTGGATLLLSLQIKRNVVRKRKATSTRQLQQQAASSKKQEA
jgi:hypothetical protein